MKSTIPGQDQASKYQTFNIERLHRSELKSAPYNPRQMDDESRKRLKKVLKQKGMVQPPVWNRQTGNLVGGHQRLVALDSLERSEDYFLDVAVVDVSKKDEIEINIALNNESIMGEFDLDLLGELKEEYADLDFMSMGFTDADLDLMFDGDLAEMLKDHEDVEKAKETLEKIKEHRQEAGKKFSEDMSDQFYFMVVCDSEAQKEDLLKRLKVPKFETYISSDKVMSALDKS